MIHWSNELKNVKTQLNNVYTKNESDGRYVKQENAGNTNISIMSNNEAYFNFNKIQTSTGYRNWTGLKFNIMFGEENQEVLKLFFKNSNEGVFMSCEADKFSFINPTTLTNAIVNLPTQNKHIASKEYVDRYANKLITVPQNEVTFTRVNDIGAQDANGNFIKWVCNNQQVKQFIWDNGRTNFRNMTFHFWMSSTKIIVNNFTVIDDSSSTIIFQLPAFTNNNQKNDFLAKRNISQIRISSAG